MDTAGEILNFGGQYRKQVANGITNLIIDEIYKTAKKAGAVGGRISGVQVLEEMDL